jgi:acetyl esterase/lipase
MKRVLMATLIAALATGVAWAQSGTDIKTTKDVEYAVHDGVSLKGDLYAPMMGVAHPAIIFIHGGGFRGGSKAGYGTNWGPYLAQRGYVVFAIDYRLFTPDHTTWPQALLDCKAALQFLRGNGPGLGIDPERIAVGGDSAGGTLSALVAMTQDFPRFANKYPMDAYASMSTRVKAALPMYGAHDMMSWDKYTQNSGNKGALEGFIGGTPDANPGGYFESSSIWYAREASKSLGELAVPNPGVKIPWFMAYGTADKVVPPEGQTVAFGQALKDAGAPVNVVSIPGIDHYWFVATKVTGKTGTPACDTMTPQKFTCSGATPVDYILPQFMDFLKKNL